MSRSYATATRDAEGIAAMPIKLTKRVVESATASGSDSLLYDTVVRGFGARVGRGGSKSYFVEYRLPGRVRRRFTIGPHGSPWTVETARAEALRILGLATDGEDPMRRRQDERRAMSVAALCDVYLSDGCEMKKASTIAVDVGRIERHIKPLLGKRPARDVTKLDIERFMRDVAAGKTATDTRTRPRGRARVRGGKGTASRTLGLLGGIFTFAIELGVREDNPVRGVKRYPGRKFERFLSGDEFRRLGVALALAENAGENLFAIQAVRLLIYTGCRKSEVLTLRWPFVDAEHRCLNLPDSKTGAKEVYLSSSAVDLLAALPRQAGTNYVFPGRSPGTHLTDLAGFWERLKESAGLEGLRLHDLRHSFASVGVSRGSSLPILGKLLGHRDVSTTQRYAHLADQPVRRAVEDIGLAIDAAMKAPAPLQDVTANDDPLPPNELAG